MGRLIDEDDVLKVLCRELCYPGAICPDGYCVEIRRKLKYVPTADAVPVVRCKDCKYSDHWYGDKRRCFLWHETGIDVFEDGYCNYAERRTDE